MKKLQFFRYLNISKQLAIGVMLLVLVGGAGCSTGSKLVANEPIIIDRWDDNIWQIAQKELKSRGFELDRVDLRSGIIETVPLVSRQWFEFWRRDVVDEKSLAQSSLHTVRRKVNVRLVAGDNDKIHIHCRVFIEKLSFGPTKTSGPVRAEEIFSSKAYRVEKNKSLGKQPYQWIPIGNDLFLEKDILESIQEEIRVK